MKFKANKCYHLGVLCEGIKFLWNREQVFDKQVADILFENCLSAKSAKVLNAIKKH